MQQPKLSSICLAVVTSALLLTSTAGFANNYKGESNYKGEAIAPAPCPQPLVLRDGLYVGAQALYDSYRTRASFAVSGFGGGVSSSNVIGSNGWGGGIFGGYGMYWNNMYYLAAELFWDGSSAGQSTSTGFTSAFGSATHNDRFSVGMSWGIGLLPGYKFNDSTLGYIRLGYEGARLRGQTSASIGTASYSSSKTQWKGGFEYGLGLETAVYPDLSVRTEFDHVGYGSFSSGATKFSATDNQFNLGLSYHFAL